MKKRKETIVVVNWTDATSYTSWMDRTQAMKEKPLAMTSVGFLVSKKGKSVIIATSLDKDQDRVGDAFIIPKGWITHITKVEIVEEKK